MAYLGGLGSRLAEYFYLSSDQTNDWCNESAPPHLEITVSCVECNRLAKCQRAEEVMGRKTVPFWTTVRRVTVKCESDRSIIGVTHPGGS